jgi:hypothetical protein
MWILTSRNVDLMGLTKENGDKMRTINQHSTDLHLCHGQVACFFLCGHPSHSGNPNRMAPENPYGKWIDYSYPARIGYVVYNRN